MKKIIFTSLHLYIFTSFLSCTNSEVSRYSQVPDEWTRGDTITFDFDSIDAQGATLAVRYDDSYPYRELKLMVEFEGSSGSNGSNGSNGSSGSSGSRGSNGSRGSKRFKWFKLFKEFNTRRI